MPALQFEDLPAAQVNEIKSHLQAKWEIEADALDRSWFSNRGKYETAKAKLDSKYQQMEFDAFTQLQQQVQEQQRVQQLIRQGTKGMGREQEAAERMRLGPEAERLAFPKPRYLTPTYLRSRDFMENIAGFSEAAEDTPGWEWGDPKKVKGSLIDQYLRWRESELYDTRSIEAKQQLDKEWDMLMFSGGRFDKWWENKEQRKPIFEARALRTPGRIAETMRKKVINISPMGRSFMKKRVTPESVAYGHWGAGYMPKPSIAPAPERAGPMPHPTTEEEYNAIPSGIEYVGTDGRIRTKR